MLLLCFSGAVLAWWGRCCEHWSQTTAAADERGRHHCCCCCACLGDARRALRRPLDDIPTLVLHGAEDMALGVELLDGIEAAVPQVRAWWQPCMRAADSMCMRGC